MPSSPSKREFNWGWLMLAASLIAAACFFGRGMAGSSSVAPKQAVAASAHSPASKRIASIVLGDNVLSEISDHLREKAVGDVSLLPEGDRLNDKIDPKTSREIVLRAVEEDGSSHKFEMILPAAWLAERNAAVGSSIYLELSEQDFAGQMEVLSIAPCPEIKAGRGRTVTGIFVHTRAHVLNLYIDGQDEPLGVTPNHPIYSVDRDDFIPAGELHEGERLLQLDGTTTRLVRTEHRHNPEIVYNLQVQGEHVYRVTSDGLLVHNSCVIGKLADLQPSKLAPGDHTLLKHLPDLENAKANWMQNSSVLRTEMRKLAPIRDGSVDPITGRLLNNTGFLRAERNLLQNHGWTYNPVTQTWNPPGI